MLTALRCPTCTAPLEPPAPGASALTCPYCGASVLISRGGAELRPNEGLHHDVVAEVVRLLQLGKKVEAVRVYRSRLGGSLRAANEAVGRIAAGQKSGTIPARAVRAGAMGCTLVIAAISVGAFFLFRQLSTTGPPPPPAIPQEIFGRPGQSSETEEPAGFATEIRRFGSEGIGAGRFEDARSVAVDAAGRVYVAEYSGGRVQVFDDKRTFQTQWTADPEMPLLGMTAARDGTVLVVQRGVITRYEGATGRRLGEIRGPLRFDDVFVALDGTLWALGDRTEVAHLTAGGDVIARVDLAESVGQRVHPSYIAASGAGDVYVSDRFSGEVYRLDAQGRFQDRFGGRGDAAGSLRMPSGLAVDGRGRLFVSDPGRGIRVFDRAGTFLDSFGGNEVVFGLAFNDADELYATHRNEHAVVVWKVMSDER